MKQSSRVWAQNIKVWLGIIGAAGVIVSGNWLASALLGESVWECWFPAYADNHLFNIGVTFLFFAASFWLVFKFRGAFLSARSFRCHPCKPRACLVMILTFPTPAIQVPSGSLPWKLEKKDKITGNIIGEPIVIEGRSLNDDTKRLPYMWWNWQQLMRALIPHLNSLQEVRLLGSMDKKGIGSHAFTKHAKILIKSYFPNSEVNIHKDAADFEDFNALKSELNEIMTELKNKYSEDEIIIDVTGGQKTASIAAATVTLNSQMNFQYVRTVPFGSVDINEDVMSYDVRVFSPLSEGV